MTSAASRRLLQHGMLPQPTHDEQARQAFVTSFRGHLAAKVAPGAKPVYERRARPLFASQHGREPRDQHDVRRALEADPYYQFWSAMQRRSQELMWEAVIDPTERNWTQLVNRARASNTSRAGSSGSLELDPTLEVPRYHTAVDIHLQPGGYHTDFGADDVAAGAIYDRALNIYLNGALGPRNALMGETLLGFFRDRWPQRAPRRILDMGCAIGNSTLPWAEAFPAAEVHAIDVGAPVLRYAHARACEFGVPVHFSQQNAERTHYRTGSFDLIVSHIMLHETSKSALGNILSECHRLLTPGGLMLHLEIPRGSTPLEKFLFNWEAYNNNETFGAHMTEVDLPAIARRAGFDAPAVIKHRIERAPEQQLYSSETVWNVLTAQR
ncbi:MAG: class I SAM-dependent methyltransferase [Steroidobacteraceae bacterium]|nr:class I SAM-dependent methyltransferase [Steroidobacteraceae bacterium]